MRLVAAVAPMAMLLATGCSSGGAADSSDPPVLDRVLLQQRVRSQLGEDVGREPEQVTCPGDLTGVPDQQMRCRLSDSGTELGLTLTVTRVDGDDVAFDIAVDDAP